MFSSIFFHCLKPRGQVIAEVESGIQGLRRWVVLTVVPLAKSGKEWYQFPSDIRLIPEEIPFDWRLVVFDFDHEKHQPPDENYYDDDEIDAILSSYLEFREIVCELRTTNIDELRDVLLHYVDDQDKFRHFQPDYPCLI
ncbi:MAG: hypothetical protein ACRC2T_11390 [Thermoguttaceae bacterium]